MVSKKGKRKTRDWNHHGLAIAYNLVIIVFGARNVYIMMVFLADMGYFY